MGRFSAVSLCALCASLAAAPSILNADGRDAGRHGPIVFRGADLDSAMVSLSDFIRRHDAQYEMLAQLDAVPSQDFRTVASAVATTPFDRDRPDSLEFGWAVTDGASLDLHLAAFNDEVLGRGDDLFIRIATAEAAKTMDFGTVASDVYSGLSVNGRVRDDPTLDNEMQALASGMRQFEDRSTQISRAVPATTDTSFDRYVESLRLF